jgi:hypothetical protein
MDLAGNVDGIRLDLVQRRRLVVGYTRLTERDLPLVGGLANYIDHLAVAHMDGRLFRHRMLSFQGYADGRRFNGIGDRPE